MSRRRKATNDFAFQAVHVRRNVIYELYSVERRTIGTMTAAFLTRECSKRGCHGRVRYRAEWNPIPKFCHQCVFTELLDLPELLVRFLKHERAMKSRTQFGTDKAQWIDREPLRAAIQGLLRRHEGDQRGLARECARDPAIRAVVYRMRRDQRRSVSTSPGGTIASPKRIGKLLQGGAPGLGKRS
ncbi:hypothetical protein LMG24235_07222 [Paraburkholderia sabiae]|nr:hypothetical protein LMG24235_07222 [Paraburkholderia sabiae]